MVSLSVRISVPVFEVADFDPTGDFVQQSSDSPSKGGNGPMCWRISNMFDVHAFSSGLDGHPSPLGPATLSAQGSSWKLWREARKA